VEQNYWRDPKNGINYQIQVQVPQDQITSVDALKALPIQGLNGDVGPLSSVAEVKAITKVGEYDRYDMQRTVSVIANFHGIDLGHAASQVKKKLAAIVNSRPRGTEVHMRGQVPALEEMLKGLSGGLALAILVVFLLLSANFESLTLSFCVISTMPAVLAGSLSFLLLTRSTLNIESFMGIIMAIGVAVANAILLVTFAERTRKSTRDSVAAALDGAKSRLRPILMTSGAMLVGMIPMAAALGEGGEQTAPLGRAVLGGVLGATTATLFVLPLVFAWVQNNRSVVSNSLDPTDHESSHH
jgi:multidrug efflux pump subunit AcrB